MDTLLAIDENTAKEISELIRNTDLSAVAASPPTVPDPESTIENRVAMIPIKGFLSKDETSSFIRFLIGGGTSYKGIIERVNAAENDPEVDSIKYVVDSPGGDVKGLFATTRVIRESKKPSVAVIDGLAASGAYALAAQADKIEASNPSDMVGSIGIVRSFYVSDNKIDVTSSNAPHKAPDPKTDSGLKAIKEQLDMVESHFINDIAAGRNIAPDIIRNDYGKGMLITADIAMRRGMVDSISSEPAPNSGGNASVSAGTKIEKKEEGKSKSKTLNTGGKSMGLRALLSENPDARAEYDAELKGAKDEGIKEGVKEERTRVTAHMSNIEHSKDVVVKAITEGAPFDQAAMSAYMNAGLAQTHGKGAVQENPGQVVTDDGGDGLGDGNGDILGKSLDTVSAATDKGDFKF